MLSSIIKYNLYFYLQKMLCVLSMNKVLKMTNAKPFLDSFDLRLTICHSVSFKASSVSSTPTVPNTRATRISELGRRRDSRFYNVWWSSQEYRWKFTYFVMSWPGDHSEELAATIFRLCSLGKMEAGGLSETSVISHQLTWRNIQ